MPRARKGRHISRTPTLFAGMQGIMMHASCSIFSRDCAFPAQLDLEAMYLPRVYLLPSRSVLGMSALIAAHPYDVPDFLPALLCELGDHLSDPVPIQVCPA
jgi:hypothetical protein